MKPTVSIAQSAELLRKLDQAREALGTRALIAKDSTYVYTRSDGPLPLVQNANADDRNKTLRTVLELRTKRQR